MEKKFSYDLAGRKLEVSIGKVAEQASGACLVTYGDTVVLTTATASKAPKEGIDFFPLTVEYVEKSYAAGKIPGGFIKREGRPTENATLTSRLIDRPIRPLFPEGYKNDVQIISTVLSTDVDNMPEVVAMNGASIALSISNIPFLGPIGSVVVGYINGEYIINPNFEQRNKSEMQLVISGTEKAIMMIEAEAKILDEEIVLGAILAGHEEIKRICKFIDEISKEYSIEKSEVIKPEFNEELFNKVEEFGREKISLAMKNSDKIARVELTEQAKDDIHAQFDEEYEDDVKLISEYIENIISEVFREQIINDKERPDGRSFDEIRNIWSEVGILPRAHGSGLFTRGQTQVLSVLTLGSVADEQTLDGLDGEENKRYMHHYNFPPYSVGDTRPLRSAGRREIGHGALAEKALLPVIPSEEEFPYAIRVVSEVLSSNGSSSQASVCGSALALMDGGVPIKAPVAGIAMGLIKEEDTVAILTDIQGLEDHLGDMDFKVAGTREGITAIQMDIKIDGIDEEILREALEKAKIARLQILDKMHETISNPREELSKFAPKIYTMTIDPEKIGEVIGSGGKTINKIIDETGVKIDIEDDGRIFIISEDKENADKAIETIEAIVKEIEVGEIYKGKVMRLTNFGAFVELVKGKEGMVHISKIAHERIDKVEDVLKVGDLIDVKVIEIDKMGRINLSRKALLPRPQKEDNVTNN
ncbi:MAG: polyribonucleotide nucleotidyltransferase [Tissierellia bacterium]|nr:polyribonucleotide nucleotidyltransferase [Tissierellia bacterium]